MTQSSEPLPGIDLGIPAPTKSQTRTRLRVGGGLLPLDLYLLPSDLRAYLARRKEQWFQFADRAGVDRWSIRRLLELREPLTDSELELVLLRVAADPVEGFREDQHIDGEIRFETIGRKLGVTRERVRQIYEESINLIRGNERIVRKLRQHITPTATRDIPCGSSKLKPNGRWTWDEAEEGRARASGRVLMRDGVVVCEAVETQRRPLRHADAAWMAVRDAQREGAVAAE